MTKKSTTKELNDKFNVKLKGSGLTAKDAKKLQFEIFTADQATKLSLEAFGGFKIPYFDLKGKPTKFYRTRFLDSTKVGFKKATNAKESRYRQPANTVNEAYLPPFINWAEYAKGEDPLIITEGELKAACATKLGYPTIGLGGVFMFRAAKQGIQLLPIFENFVLEKRVVYVIFDSDAATNPNVAAAEAQLCRELSMRGAIPYIVRLPNISPDGKTGLDDFMVNMPLEQFRQLLEASHAEPFALAQELHKLNEEVIAVLDPGMVYEIKTGLKMSPRLFTDFNYATRTFLQRKASAGGDIKTEVVATAKEWIKWPKRAAAGKLVYEPGESEITNDNNLNTWKGWPFEPIKGDVQPWKELLDFIFTGEDENRKWFEQWCAYPLQNPGAKLFTAVVIWGLMTGTGKTLIGYTMMRLYGDNAIEIGNEDLENKDNDYAENKQFAVGEEITGNDKRELADRIKRLITRESIRINIKYVARFTIRDCINYLFTSNHPDAFYIDKFDRRYFVKEVVHTKPREREFYNRYDAWYKSDTGMSALFHYFLSLDLSTFDPMGPAPITQAKRNMIDQGRSELDTWVTQLLEDPESILRVAGMQLKFDLYRAEDLIALYDPSGGGNIGGHRVTAGGMARALTKAGFRKPVEVGCRTKDGQFKLWAIRNYDKYKGMGGAVLGEHYDKEREQNTPKQKFARGGNK